MEKNSTLKPSCAVDFEKMGLEIPNSLNSAPPPKGIIENILNYSRALAIIKTKKGAYLEFVMN